MHYLDCREYRFHNVLFDDTVKLDQTCTALAGSDASHGQNFALCEPLDLAWEKGHMQFRCKITDIFCQHLAPG